MRGFNCTGIPENVAIGTFLLRSAIPRDILRPEFFFGKDRERRLGLVFAFRDKKNDGGLVSFRRRYKEGTKEDCKEGLHKPDPCKEPD